MRKVDRQCSPVTIRFHAIPLFAVALTIGWLMSGCAFSGGQLQTTSEPKTANSSVSNISTAGGKDASSDRSPYPENVVQSFMNACVKSGGSHGNCACTIDKIQDRYSLEEFGRVEVEAQKTGNLPDEILEFIKSCRTAS